MHTKSFFAAAALLLAAPAGAAEPYHLLFCVPDAPGSTEAAAPYLKPLFKMLESAAGWAEGSLQGLFTPSEKRCLRELKKPRASLAVLSLGLYLSLKKRFKLRPLAVAEVGGSVTTRYHVLVKQGAPSSLESLSGARFFTNHGSDRRLLARLILGGKLGDKVEVKRTRQPLKALRAVRAGTEQATVVDDLELEKLKLLPLAQDLQVIHTSRPLPNPIVVAVGKRVSAASVEALTSKILTLCRGGSGCENLPLSGFTAPDVALLEELAREYRK